MLSRISTVRERIGAVIHDNDSTPALDALIKRELATLCSAFPVEQAATAKALPLFIQRYIESAVDYLEMFLDMSRLAQLEPYTNPLLEQAENYFFEPPASITENTSPIEQLLAEAYLCHRLLEELNDQVAALRGVVLAPIDITDSNIIIHTLLGDELANKLDQSILIQLELAAPNTTIFNDDTVQQLALMRQQHGWAEVKERWPCLNQEVMSLLSLESFLGPRF